MENGNAENEKSHPHIISKHVLDENTSYSVRETTLYFPIHLEFHNKMLF